uniref:Uncharacterized protein n=1 Tax=Kalanchoe fedtschenkoi TaxID=63787 RepID=A0A7N0U8R5_KALFE
MAFRAVLFLLASLLLVSTKGIVDTVPAAAAPAEAPAPAPIPIKTPPAAQTPTPAPVVKKPAPTPTPAAPRPPTVAPRPRIKSLADCRPQCNERCSLHSRPNVCVRACNTCCTRCRCVPPGTAGNKEVCGKCYAEMTTKGGRRKCP